MKSLQGTKYYACFKDYYSKYRRIFFIKQNRKVPKSLRTFLNEVSTVGHRVKVFRCDGGKEFACEEVLVSSVIVVLYCCCRYRMSLNKTELQNVKTVRL